jgi:hypothetical protein
MVALIVLVVLCAIFTVLVANGNRTGTCTDNGVCTQWHDPGQPVATPRSVLLLAAKAANVVVVVLVASLLAVTGCLGIATAIRDSASPSERPSACSTGPSPCPICELSAAATPTAARTP